MEKERETILIVLAAGEASRMGKPKQILPVHGVPLIDYQLARWEKLFLLPTVLVTGAHSGKVRAASYSRHVQWVHNPRWKSGLGSSITKAIGYVLQKYPSSKACMVLLLDQVFIGPVHLRKLLQAGSEYPESIIASAFGQSKGPPVIFPRKFWPDLLDLEPRKGAAALFRKYPDQLRLVHVPGAAVDIDTPADYNMFLKRLSGSGPD